MAYTVSRAGWLPGKGRTPGKPLGMGVIRPGTAAVPSNGGECSPGEGERVRHRDPDMADSPRCHETSQKLPSPEAGAMGVAGRPLRLTAPICWMWQGGKATPGLR